MSDQPALELLMQQALAGDQQAYGALLQATSRLLKPFLARYLNHGSDLDDVLQEVLLSIHKARHTYDGARPYKPWVFAIAKFRLFDYLRTHYADHLHHAVDIAEFADILSEPVTETGFNYESISAEIGQLPQKQAAILQMMHQQGYTAKEVAAKLQMKESAVKVAAHRAYKVLKKVLVSK